MTKAKTCTIRLLNKSYDIKCPDEEADNLQHAALKLNGHLQHIKKKFKQIDEYQALLLAALHISHEWVACQKQQEEQRQQMTQFICSLEHKINQVVVSPSTFNSITATDSQNS